MTDAERLRAVAEVIGTWLHDPVPSNAELIARIRTILDGGTYSASRFVSPVPGVMIGAITPEASELIDAILAAWDAHAPNVRPNNDLIGVTTPDRETLYGFVYWLCRWSGLVRPVRTILDDVPSVEWHTRQCLGMREVYRASLSDGTLDCERESEIAVAGWSVHVYATNANADAYFLPTLAAAKARAVALYVALRGVT